MDSSPKRRCISSSGTFLPYQLNPRPVRFKIFRTNSHQLSHRSGFEDSCYGVSELASEISDLAISTEFGTGQSLLTSVNALSCKNEDTAACRSTV